MSEIDDIFAAKAKGKASVKIPSSSSSILSRKPEKKTKKKKKAPSASAPRDASPAAPSSSKKRPPPETVVDTSHHLSGSSKRHKSEHRPEEPKSTKHSGKNAGDPNAAFKDSRGTADRRKTEEGWLVYKEDELGIGDEGGDTPLCPFDCECCF
ncbi:DUF1764-domain-containing protein [Pholiota conissans]|uniref:DUF1764-domain-containing protein n=1 Tax=Pholiota conissans TaxID=109636 RepID=A0A9P5YV00_9AGAR|nr:DUF1764-domain-containing protein [Pholiota conissans]